MKSLFALGRAEPALLTATETVRFAEKAGGRKAGRPVCSNKRSEISYQQVPLHDPEPPVKDSTMIVVSRMVPKLPMCAFQ